MANETILLIEDEKNNIQNRMAVTLLIAEFHRLLMDLSGNRTLNMVSQALRGLVDAHLSLSARRRQGVDPELSEKQLRFGLKSHSRLVDLIEAKDGDAAEEHWKRHMVAAGEVWLEQIGRDTSVELLD
jgi:DNA-binding FadR family transcriptional regulator